MTMRQPVKGAAAFSKTIAVLQLVADSEHPVTSAELVKITEMPRPTMRRILKALVAEDMVVLGPNKTFTLGPRHIELARKSLDQNLLLQTAKPELDWLSSETQAAVFIGIPMGSQFIIVGQEANRPVFIEGCSHFHACAIAKSYLAFVPSDRQQRIIDSIEMPSLTERTPTCAEQLKAELERTAADGYSVSDEQFRRGEKRFGACVVDVQSSPCAGIGFGVNTSETDAGRESQLVSALLKCRDRINQKLQQANYERPTVESQK